MALRIIFQFFTLSIFAFFMGFVFCDYFKLHNLIKVCWFLLYLITAGLVMHWKQEFQLDLILPVPLLVAIILGKLAKNPNAYKNL